MAASAAAAGSEEELSTLEQVHVMAQVARLVYRGWSLLSDFSTGHPWLTSLGLMALGATWRYLTSKAVELAVSWLLRFCRWIAPALVALLLLRALEGQWVQHAAEAPAMLATGVALFEGKVAEAAHQLQEKVEQLKAQLPDIAPSSSSSSSEGQNASELPLLDRLAQFRLF